MIKFILYLFILPLVVYAIGGLNLNGIFKKNKIYQYKCSSAILPANIWELPHISKTNRAPR